METIPQLKSDLVARKDALDIERAEQRLAVTQGREKIKEIDKELATVQRLINAVNGRKPRK